MVFAGKEPTSAELEITYGSYPVHAALSPLTRCRYVELLERFEPYRRYGRILDVGSGSGFFLDTAMERGWEAHGTEYDPAMLETCKARGMHMRQGLLALGNYEPSSFDVITSFEVLEHLVHPRPELEHFFSLLRPGGSLYLTTPNFNAISRRIAGGQWRVVNYPEHLNYYTPYTLSKAVKRSGFRIVSISTTGISLMRIRNSFSSGSIQENTDPENDDQKLRNRIENNSTLRLIKSITNRTLTTLGIGDSMKLLAIKPQ